MCDKHKYVGHIIRMLITFSRVLRIISVLGRTLTSNKETTLFVTRIMILKIRNSLKFNSHSSSANEL